MVGVRPDAQGQGHGRALMEAVHQLSVESDNSEGVGLTTEDPNNVPLYARFGYRLLDRLEVAPGLTTWGFYRDN